eukprot:6428351-Pyramimonas_sp.AAC.1
MIVDRGYIAGGESRHGLSLQFYPVVRLRLYCAPPHKVVYRDLTLIRISGVTCGTSSSSITSSHRTAARPADVATYIINIKNGRVFNIKDGRLYTVW